MLNFGGVYWGYKYIPHWSNHHWRFIPALFFGPRDIPSVASRSQRLWKDPFPDPNANFDHQCRWPLDPETQVAPRVSWVGGQIWRSKWWKWTDLSILLIYCLLKKRDLGRVQEDIKKTATFINLAWIYWTHVLDPPRAFCHLLSYFVHQKARQRRKSS